MSKRTALLSLLFFGVFSIAFVQSSELKTVHANDIPLTSPVTPPEAMFTVAGKVTKKTLQLRPLIWRVLPVEGIVMRLENVFTHETMTTETDEDGRYSFDVDETGLYKVSPMVNKKVDGFAVPPLSFIKLKNHDTLHEDFQLLDLH